MPQPTAKDVHIDSPLTNISVAYIQSVEHYIATKIFPVVPVEKISDKYYIFNKEDWLRDEAQRRGDAEESAGSGFRLSKDSYNCDSWALHKDIGHKARANQDNMLDLDRAATEYVTQRLLVKQERDFTEKYFQSGVWGTDYTPAATWDDYTSGDPIEDIEAAKEAVLSVTGLLPNTLVLGYSVFRQLKHHPTIIDRIKYTSSETVTTETLARLFEIERVYYAMAIYVTSPEGAATPTYAFTHGDHALLAHVAGSPALLTPSAGYTFAWKGVSAGLGESIAMSKFYIDEKKADRIEGEAAWDNKVCGSDLGYFFEQVVA